MKWIRLWFPCTFCVPRICLALLVSSPGPTKTMSKRSKGARGRQCRNHKVPTNGRPFHLADSIVGHKSAAFLRNTSYKRKIMTRRRHHRSPSSHMPPTTATFSLLSSAALCCLLPFGRQQRTTVHAWVIPKSFENVLLPNSPRTTNGQQQEGLLSPPLHISSAESLIIGTTTSGREGGNSAANQEVSTAAQAVSLPQDKLQQIETPLDQWLQDMMTTTAATIAGIMSTGAADEEKDIAAQTSVQTLNRPIPSGQNQIPVIDRIAKVRERNAYNGVKVVVAYIPEEPYQFLSKFL